MRYTVFPVLAAVLLAAPVHAQADQREVDRLIGELRPRTGGPITTRGLPKPGAPVNQPSAAQTASASQAATTPRAATPAAVTSPAQEARPSANMSVLFPTGSSDLTPTAEMQLRVLGTALTHPDMGQSSFLIEGHTDTVGDKAMNQALSEKRAEVVVNFLIQKFQIPPARLTAKGVGEDQLLVPTADNTAEPRNRRVHIVNLGG